MPYFDERHMPEAKNEYVCWMDIMGTKNKMDNSVRTCGVFIFKLHAAILESIESGIDVKAYPVMDGVYITSPEKGKIEVFIKKVFAALGQIFCDETKFHYKFLVKASIAYGPIIHGIDIPNKACRQFGENEGYRNSILLGAPMIQAISGENSAPPFGVFVHESARAFAANGEIPFGFKWWKWYINNPDWDEKKSILLKNGLETYFDNCNKIYLELNYPKDRIDAHRLSAQQYFENL